MKNDIYKNLKLDKEEQELLEAFERGEFVSVGNLEKRRREISEAAKNIRLMRNKRINIHMREKDLQQIKKKAKKHGLPYQTLIHTILQQYAQGKISLVL